MYDKSVLINVTRSHKVDLQMEQRVELESTAFYVFLEQNDLQKEF